MVKVRGIMASTSEGVVGRGGGMPWHYPEEIKYFRAVTEGHVVIMGRRTYEAVPPSFLHARPTVVLSRKLSPSSAQVCFVTSLEESLEAAQRFLKEQAGRRIFMIGGAELAHMFLRARLLSSFLLTTIHHPFSGETVLDLTFFQGWKKRLLQAHAAYTIEMLKP